MNLDIRKGRTHKQKRNLAISYMEIVREVLGIKHENQYLTYTDHTGLEFNLYENHLRIGSKMISHYNSSFNLMSY